MIAFLFLVQELYNILDVIFKSIQLRLDGATTSSLQAYQVIGIEKVGISIFCGGMGHIHKRCRVKICCVAQTEPG
jgi:hypothetical protein